MTEGLAPQVAEMLKASGAFLSGHFILSSGRHSGRYLQCALLCARPDYCEAMAGMLAAKLKSDPRGPDFDLVLSPAIGGIVIGYEVARALNLPAFFAERDAEGTMRLRRGFSLSPGQKILIVEDVVTTGGSVLEVARVIEDQGAQVAAYACLFDRSGGAFAPGPPVLSVAELTFPTYPPSECPLCAEGKLAPAKPGSRKSP